MLRFAMIAATILPLAVPAVASAKPKPIQFSHACGCICETPGYADSNVYRSKQAIDCQAYVGRTCNVDTGGGMIRSGKITHCVDYDDPSGAAATLPSFTPANPAGTADPGQTSPLHVVPSVLPKLHQVE